MPNHGMSARERDRLRALAQQLPDWALDAELAARRGGGTAVVDLPGVHVDPVAALVEFGGRAYGLNGRPLEVVYALALAHRAGHARVDCSTLAARIWRGWHLPAARNLLLTALRRADALVPGLVLTHRSGNRVSYSLATTRAHLRVVS